MQALAHQEQSVGNERQGGSRQKQHRQLPGAGAGAERDTGLDFWTSTCTGLPLPKMFGLHGPLNITAEREIVPHEYRPNLKIVSIESMLEDTDSAIIWRGPLKHGVIQQFLADCRWDDLDFLVIDSPPGTGDEALSISRLIPDAKALIVTTPQEVALADVRKSINFCRKVGMEILGLVENMSGLFCPHCSQFIPIFQTGGGRKTSDSDESGVSWAIALRSRSGRRGRPWQCRCSMGTQIRPLYGRSGNSSKQS